MTTTHQQDATRTTIRHSLRIAGLLIPTRAFRLCAPMILLIWLAGVAAPAEAAGILVNNTADNLTASDGNCTLREAIMNANSDSDTTSGDCAAGTGTDTINLPAGTYTLTITGTGEDANATGDLDITDLDGLSIFGGGADVTIIQAGTASPVSGTCTDCVDRVMHHHIDANLTLEDLTLRHGLLAPGTGVPRGGGLRLESCDQLSITRVTATDNRIIGGRGIGGGIDANLCDMTIVNSAIVNNIAEGPIGGTGEAGGLGVNGGSASLLNVTISGNVSQTYGGGMWCQASPCLVVNSTITDNHTTTAPSSGDFSGQGGGGLKSDSGAVITLQNTIVVGNTDVERSNVGPIASDDCGMNTGASLGFYASAGYNLVGAGTGCPTSGTADLTTVSPASELDLTLALNSGTTPNHVLVAGSQALDHIPNGTNGCGTTITDDQRGVNRPGGPACDVGSVEETAAPELSIASTIPAAELETVDVDVDLTTNGASIAATAFSVDYDETCLSFDDTDGDADNIPDDLAFNLPAGFAVSAFHDLGDSDGEIDISIADLAPPIATLPDGSLLTITFTSTCSPATGTTIIAPVGFSSDPAATFSDDLAVDVSGATSGGSVEIWPGPRGDCNGTGAVSVADLIADALEIFDGDGSFWADVPGSTFLGSPVGCDANDDTAVNAGDISCTILLIFGGTCGGQSFTGPAGDKAFGPRTSPVLGLEEPRRERGTLWIPVVFSAGTYAISSVAFSLDLADRGLTFDPFDGDGDGIPDAVRLPQGRPDLVDVRYDATDRGGELDFTLAHFDRELDDGLLLEVAVQPLWHGALGAAERAARFGKRPAASFGDLSGNAVPGRTVEIRDRKIGGGR